MTTSTITREQRVEEFRAAAGDGNFKSNPELMPAVWNCLAEEMVELAEAGQKLYAVGFTNTDREDYLEARAHFVKELADAQYVLSQIAVFYDVDLETAFGIVAANNMTKVGLDGKVVRREDGKILKPVGYQPVTTDDLRGL